MIFRDIEALSENSLRSIDKSVAWRRLPSKQRELAVPVSDSLQQWLDELGDVLTLFARQFVASHADAEEALQDGFVRFWRIRHKATDPKALLFSCVKRAAIDAGRKDRRRQRRERVAAAQTDQESLFECPVEQRERTLEVEKAMETLFRKTYSVCMRTLNSS